MQVLVDIPEELAGGSATEMSRLLLELAVLDGIREQRISEAQGQRILGIASEYEMDGFLKEHGVLLNLTHQDVIEEIEMSRPFLKKSQTA